MRRRRWLQATAAMASPWASASAPAAPPAATGGWRAQAFLGTHCHRLALLAGEPGRPTAWPDVPIGLLRIWDARTTWADVQPAAGEWRWLRLDAWVTAAQAQGCPLLYTFGATPRWASARPDEPGPYGPGSGAEPARLDDWGAFVRALIHRYRGRIGAYEVWNEPHLHELARDRARPGFFTGSLATLLAMASIVREAIDAIDPAARLLTPGFVNGPDRLEMFIAGGGAALCDAVAYHFYARDDEALEREISAVRRVMQRQRVEALPLWNTEFGAETWSAEEEPLPPGVTPTDDVGAAVHLGRCVLVNAAEGIEHCCYYAWDNDRSGMVRRDGQRTPRHTAYANVARWLGSERPSFESRGELTAVRLADGPRRRLALWARTSQARWAVPPGWRIAGTQGLLDASDPAGLDAPADPTALTTGRQPLHVVLVPTAGAPS